MAGGARWSAVEPGRRLLASDVRMKRTAANINAAAPNCIHWLTVLFFKRAAEGRRDQTGNDSANHCGKQLRPCKGGRNDAELCLRNDVRRNQPHEDDEQRYKLCRRGQRHADVCGSRLLLLQILADEQTALPSETHGTIGRNAGPMPSR